MLDILKIVAVYYVLVSMEWGMGWGLQSLNVVE